MSEDVIKALEAEKKELLERLAYASAEVANLKRLMEKEIARAEEMAARKIVGRLLTFYENFEGVMKNLRPEDVSPTLREAMEMLFREFEGVLQSIGVEKMDVVGQEFNPFDHEAVDFTESEEVSKDTVIEVISNGYRLSGQIIKPPKVKVARAKKPPEQNL